jgi:hypothetical protein
MLFKSCLTTTLVMCSSVRLPLLDPKFQQHTRSESGIPSCSLQENSPPLKKMATHTVHLIPRHETGNIYLLYHWEDMSTTAFDIFLTIVLLPCEPIVTCSWFRNIMCMEKVDPSFLPVISILPFISILVLCFFFPIFVYIFVLISSTVLQFILLTLYYLILYTFSYTVARFCCCFFHLCNAKLTTATHITFHSSRHLSSRKRNNSMTTVKTGFRNSCMRCKIHLPRRLPPFSGRERLQR